MIDARTHTRREGNKGEKNGLLKMGSSMSKWGLTPQIPSDIEESGHGKDGPNAYRLQPYPYGLSGRNTPFFETIASLPGFGMAPEGHLSYSFGPNIRTGRTKPCSVRV